MSHLASILLGFVFDAGWQIAVLTAAAAFCARLMRDASARHTHVLWVVTLVLALAVPTLMVAGAGSFTGQRSVVTVAPNMGARPSLSRAPLGPTTAHPIVSLDRGIAADVSVLFVFFVLGRGVLLFRGWPREHPDPQRERDGPSRDRARNCRSMSARLRTERRAHSVLSLRCRASDRPCHQTGR